MSAAAIAIMELPPPTGHTDSAPTVAKVLRRYSEKEMLGSGKNNNLVGPSAGGIIWTVLLLSARLKVDSACGNIRLIRVPRLRSSFVFTIRMLFNFISTLNVRRTAANITEDPFV